MTRYDQTMPCLHAQRLEKYTNYTITVFSINLAGVWQAICGCMKGECSRIQMML